MAGQYYGSIPGIQQAYQNDPKNKLAQSALALGTSTAPVAQGGWAITDGLARAAQAVLGAVMQKGQDKKFAAREAAYTDGMAQAAQLATAQPPANPMAAAAGALGGPSAPQMAPVAPPMAPPAQMAPQGGAGGPMAGMAAAVGAMPPMPGGTGPSRGAPSFINPLGGAASRTSDTFGGKRNHNGIDYAAPGGTPIMAASDGVVLNAGTNNRSGNFVRIKHADGTITGYAHLKDAPGVKPGEAVAGGAVIGAVGSTGRSTGNHLHFTVTDPSGRKVDPSTLKYGEQSAPAAPAMTGPTAGIVAPTMEAVPELPQAPTQAPAAPERPAEVQSSRIAMAQSLMQSGNPDLMQIAQTYLDKGLDEQNAARTLASQQEQQQGQTGYTAALNDYGDARSTARNAAVTTSRDATQRNFNREQTFGAQTFQAGQGQVQREYDTSAREDQQQFQAGENAAQRAFQAAQAASERSFTAGENQKNRDNQVSLATAAQAAKGNRNAYFSTPTGLKMQQEAGQQINANNDGIAKYQRFLDLNEKESTGGFAQNTLGRTGVYGWIDSGKAEMASLQNDTTLANLGGSLGVAISDGDRRFISESNVGLDKPRTANQNIARAKIGAMRRKNDYLVEFANAQADGTAAQFQKEWAMFAQSTPVVMYDKNGNATGANDKPVSYSEWRASRPRFDANGKRVK